MNRDDAHEQAHAHTPLHIPAAPKTLETTTMQFLACSLQLHWVLSCLTDDQSVTSESVCVQSKTNHFEGWVCQNRAGPHGALQVTSLNRQPLGNALIQKTLFSCP